LVLTLEQSAIVTDEENYWLRRFLNDLLFRLDESGRLADMRQRWLEEIYAYPRRAATEGLPFAAIMGILAIVAIGTLTPRTGWAVDRAEAEETARLLAKLLKAGRFVIEQNQQLIDDQHKGDKGFTPEVFEQQLVQEFRQQTGIDLSKL